MIVFRWGMRCGLKRSIMRFLVKAGIFYGGSCIISNSLILIHRSYMVLCLTSTSPSLPVLSSSSTTECRFESGLALMPILSTSKDLPYLSSTHDHKFLALDVDGSNDLPSDWYLRICGLASIALKSTKGSSKLEEVMPRKMLLVDYWHSRPGPRRGDRELEASSSAGPSSEHHIQALAAQAVPDRADEPPPPPYSLIADDEEEEDAPIASGSGSPPGLVASPDPIVDPSRTTTPANLSGDSSAAASDYLSRLTATLGSVSLNDQTIDPGPSATAHSSSHLSSPWVNEVEVAAFSHPDSNADHPDPPHLTHAYTLPAPPHAAPAWPSVSVPTFGEHVPSDSDAHAYSPHHANTLPAHYSPTASTTPFQPSWGQSYPGNQEMHVQAARPGFPSGEAASYYDNHPALSPPSSPPPPAPHHAHSWGSASPEWNSGSGPFNNQAGMASPPTSFQQQYQYQHPMHTGSDVGAGYMYPGPHHAYTVGPGVSPYPPGTPWTQQQGSMMGYGGPNQQQQQFSPPPSSAASSSSFAPPPLPPRPSMSSTGSSSTRYVR